MSDVTPAAMTDAQFLRWFAEMTPTTEVPKDVTPTMLIERLVALGVISEPSPDVLLVNVVQLAIERAKQQVKRADSERFVFQQYESGQIYVRDKRDGAELLHAEIEGPHKLTVQTTSEGCVTIDKLYGPLIMWGVRVSIDFDKADWVIEREYGAQDEWREAARIPGQLEVTEFCRHYAERAAEMMAEDDESE